MVENKDKKFLMENLKMKRKKDKKFFDFFSNFPDHDLNFHGK